MLAHGNDWKVVNLKLSEILANPTAFTHIRNVVARFTNHPLEDLNRGWGRAGMQEPAPSLWAVVRREHGWRRLVDLDEELLRLDAILYRLAHGLAASAGERVIGKLVELDLIYEPLEALQGQLTEAEYAALVAELLERYEAKYGYTIAHDAGLGGWYLAERGLSGFHGTHLPEALEYASGYTIPLDSYQTLLAFHPSWVGWNTDSDVYACSIVSATPDPSQPVYIIQVDTTEWAWNWPEE